jgi:hypothetical protein
MPETPEERRLRCTANALSRSATTRGSVISAPARAARLQKFYDETDPELPEAERQRQADAALRKAMTELSRKAARARRLASEIADDASELTG